MKILEITEFSAGICGVWTRVLSESKELIKLGHEVTVFSSNIEKGSDKIAKPNDNIEGINIRRFKSKRDILDYFLTKNVTHFEFKKELIDLKPDLVVTHLIHPHSFKALSICKKYNIPCYIIPHAPFNVKRNFVLSIATKLFYLINVKPKLKKFNKVIAITHWEEPYLLKLEIEKNKIVYIPNGIPEEYFTQKFVKKDKDILFLGRVAPVKDIETLLMAAKKLPDLNFSIVGPAEEEYLKLLKETIEKNNIKNINFLSPIYDLKEKIRLIDNHKIFVLPSKREAMPQVLLETMARKKIVISSKTDGGKEIIKDKENGFLFNIGDYNELVNIIKGNIKGNIKIQNNARKDSEKYKWSKLIKDVERTYCLG